AQQLALGEFSPLRGVGAEPGAPAPDFIEAVARSGEALPRARQMVIEELERRYVQYMLEKHDGNVTRA
ncbi:MAG: Fis family transcriptional regulator, partial [Deltaproteobacteria bacterium]|nr:Fis family transcriptional regulator [Deltaproteobacteria bacterium]